MAYKELKTLKDGSDKARQLELEKRRKELTPYHRLATRSLKALNEVMQWQGHLFTKFPEKLSSSLTSLRDKNQDEATIVVNYPQAGTELTTFAVEVKISRYTYSRDDDLPKINSHYALYKETKDLSKTELEITLTLAAKAIMGWEEEGAT